jgi:hypothetical protein
MWDGVYGRTHVYSYVKAKDGNWYKIVDSSVTEVRIHRSSTITEMRISQNLNR